MVGRDQWARFSRPAAKGHIHQVQHILCRRSPVPFILRNLRWEGATHTDKEGDCQQLSAKNIWLNAKIARGSMVQ